MGIPSIWSRRQPDGHTLNAEPPFFDTVFPPDLSREVDQRIQSGPGALDLSPNGLHLELFMAP